MMCIKPVRGPMRERGESLIGLAAGLLLVFALALPAVEFGRMVHDFVQATSASEDIAKAKAAKPTMTQADVERYLAASYPEIASSAHVTLEVGGRQVTPYTHRLNDGAGGYNSRASNAASRSVNVTIVVSKDFVTAAGSFIAAVTPAKSYTVSASAHATIDDTVESGGW